MKDGTHGSFERVRNGVPFLSAKNIGQGRVGYDETDSRISESDYREINRSGYLRRGDLLVTIVGTIGRAAIFDFAEPVAFQRSVASLRLIPVHEPRFFYYFSQSRYFQGELQASTRQSAQGGVYLGDLGALEVCFPADKSEQERIANFLDREGAEIDLLLSKKQRLIDLLDEERQALV